MKRARAERLRLRWTLATTSRLTGIAISDLSKLERGLNFSGAWVRRLSRALGVPPERLLDDVGEIDGR